ncbi:MULTISPECIES: DEAD/DEAH box helicase family protein [Muribaculum]|jgi:type III restriction enzyme|uniref:restriction endonuclease n=12 Tax=Muribaculaceae TaxID=2005473 RepID=UPI000F4A0CB1|nr:MULTISPECIES: DEAD/DEAH box helicase family protein [Muribaculum]MCX4279257.1 DEAD/DEAH box helicase family protein [Muribaculum sp.]ROT15559.1 DEAD/DEAH box helicase [Muribaculaceae bacterium Isolate-102 (HZI)]TGY04009.1 DEAD/DEAH box helicase [Muribaculum sp. NM65_B17]THG43330.1 DEAD/DEAH box helicase [Muribaculaceae bacterium]
MKFKLENPQHQITAIQSVADIFRGMERNTYDNAHNEDIHMNVCSLSSQQILDNIQSIIHENGVSDTQAFLVNENDACIEMETGTGKTLTYLQTAYELFRQYGLSKFIVLVPSVPIRQGVIDTFENFKEQLSDKYDVTPDVFVYDSSKISLLHDFITSDNLQIMVLTMASFNSENNILNQVDREDMFNNLPHLESLAQTHPIILMDEPQEGMDTDNSKQWIAKLQPLFKLRYSATHAVKKNVLYQLTPAESYRLGLVKKLEVLTVSESNDEATLKLEISQVQSTATQVKVKLKLWKLNKSKGRFEFKESGLLKKDDNLADKSGNESYRDYTISRIYKSMTDRKWHVVFTNGSEIIEGSSSSNKEQVWALQLEWLIRRHFENRNRLRPQGIKNLSLIFIDRVANYMSPERPIIKQLFEQKYRQVYAEFNDGKQPADSDVLAAQGFYFAKTTQGEYTDKEDACRKNKEIFDEILHNKQRLLSFESPIDFIFSHSALGVGWDNPNVFGIATLNESYSENKKRQEIGRGLRICVNQSGERVYDSAETPEEEQINQLTIVPNETYETFARSYQQEYEEQYGIGGNIPKPKHTHKGKRLNRVTFKLKRDKTFMSVFRRFWNVVAQKTVYRIHMDEDELIRRSIESLNEIRINDYILEVQSMRITDISNLNNAEYYGSESYAGRARFNPHDLVEEISEKTGLCYTSVLKIVAGINNQGQYIKNPPVFMEQAVFKIRQVQLDELVRCIEYTPTGNIYEFKFDDFSKDGCEDWIATPNHGVWDKSLYDSLYEKEFAKEADKITNTEVLCFLKFPSWYKIPTPIGNYEPDFGVVLHKRLLSSPNEDKEYYFVVEIKGTDDINDTRALTPHEIGRIKCAVKHFKSLGIEAYYKAPIKEYDTFKAQANQTINNNGNI